MSMYIYVAADLIPYFLHIFIRIRTRIFRQNSHLQYNYLNLFLFNLMLTLTAEICNVKVEIKIDGFNTFCMKFHLTRWKSRTEFDLY
jgi:hypothetical protein